MTLSQAYRAEMGSYRASLTDRDVDGAFAHLERAHILSQRHLVRHTHTHLAMLRIGLHRRDRREVGGQVLRLLAVPVAWITGWVPEGNTGGANVSALLPMEPPEDLRPLVAGRGPWWQRRGTDRP